MAGRLIQQWRLAVLRVQLDLTGRTPAVATELASYPGRTPHRLWARRDPLEAFGLAESKAPPRQLRLPSDLRDAIATSLTADPDLENEAALWLRLAPPYGYLGAVPWEESLLEVTDVPVLRVPDRLPAAVDPGRVWSVAIGVSAPADSNWAAPYLVGLVKNISGEVSAPVDVDVFADARTVAQLPRYFDPPVQVHVHKPSDARQASEDRSRRRASELGRWDREGRLARPASPGRIWADWIAAGLAGRAVRALHVVLDATWDSDRPILALSPDPSQPSNTKDSAFITADDVRLLADELGAATLSFGSPPDATSDVAMRVIADGVGQQRPGATIYSSIPLDRGGTWLAETYGFLAGTPADRSGEPVLRYPSLAPRHPSLFAYLQPEQVRASLADEWPKPPPTTDRVRAPSPADDLLPSAVLPEGYQVTPEADLSGYYASAETVPTWVAASECYIGTQLANLSQSATAPEPVGFKRAYEQGAAEALAEIQEIVAKHVRPT
jgi:hypothetical protein